MQNKIVPTKADNMKGVHQIVPHEETSLPDWEKQSIKFAQYLKQDRDRLTKQAA